MPLGDTIEFNSPYLREVYVHELAVGEVGPLRGRLDIQHYKVYTV